MNHDPTLTFAEASSYITLHPTSQNDDDDGDDGDDGEKQVDVSRSCPLVTDRSSQSDNSISGADPGSNPCPYLHLLSLSSTVPRVKLTFLTHPHDSFLTLMLMMMLGMMTATLHCPSTPISLLELKIITNLMSPS